MKHMFFSHSWDEVDNLGQTMTKQNYPRIPTFMPTTLIEEKKTFPSSSFIQESIDSSITVSSNEITMQPELLAYDIWIGEVLKIEEDSFIIDVRNEKMKHIRRILKVKKRRVVGDIENAFKGMDISVIYKKYKTFQYQGIYKQVTKEETRFILSQPVKVPLSVREHEFEERMKRYSYMFKDGV